MAANVLKIGIREFREHLPQYLNASSPVAITKHGETIGFYLPTKHHPEKAELEALKNAAAQLEGLMTSMGTTENELVAEFCSLRKKDKKGEK